MNCRTLRHTGLALAALLLGACAQLPPAAMPELPSAPAFRQVGVPWVSAEPADAEPRGDWWTVYQDPELDRLQQELLANSPDLASALARYEQARAVSDTLRAAQSPTVGASLDFQRNRQSERRPLRVLGPTSPDDYNSATLGLALGYEVDLWGRVRQRVDAGLAETQAAQADLGAARLALQAQLADTLLALRGLDHEAALLSDSEAAYARAAELVAQRHAAGIASGVDLARAQTQLEVTRSQRGQLQARRAVHQNAIAALVGAHASTFAIAPQLLTQAVPVIPVGLPSTLLQRRPDIAAAQRRVAAASSSVGVARSAIFPALNLNAAGGFQSSSLSRFIDAPNLFWAIGPSLVATAFDGGRRKAETARAEAVLDEAGQRYRSVVLGAFQQVEDQLALLSNYGEAAAAERRAVTASQRASELAETRYREGATSYLEVVSAQAAQLQARRSGLDLETRQRRATVQLVRALGGGWSATEPPLRMGAQVGVNSDRTGTTP
jgi:NodT family efflux transporter outer membrane factor (OMF) lipoprotein